MPPYPWVCLQGPACTRACTWPVMLTPSLGALRMVRPIPGIRRESGLAFEGLPADILLQLQQACSQNQRGRRSCGAALHSA